MDYVISAQPVFTESYGSLYGIFATLMVEFEVSRERNPGRTCSCLSGREYACALSMHSNFRTAGDRFMTTVDIRFCRVLHLAVVPLVLVLTLAIIPTQRCVAQVQASGPESVARLDPASGDARRMTGTANDAAAKTAAATAPDPEISPAVAKQFA